MGGSNQIAYVGCESVILRLLTHTSHYAKL